MQDETILKRLHLSVDVVSVLKVFGIDFDIDTEILLSYDSLEHATKHSDIQGHLAKIEKIVTNPRYVGYRTTDNSIELAQKFDDKTICIIVPVRPSNNGLYFVRTSHRINVKRFDKYLERGKFIDLTKL